MPYCSGADGVKLYYEDFGDGPAMVFTNAGLQTHKQWEGQVASLADEFRTITYDWRGTGQSDKPRSGYTAERAAADLCALVETLGVAPAILVGHGIGTHVTFMAATSRPDLVRGMVLASGGPWFCGERDGVAGGLSNEFLDFIVGKSSKPKDARGISDPQIFGDLAEHWLFHRPQTPAVVNSVLEQALEWPHYPHAAYLKSMREVDHRHRFGQVRWPTLIIQGRHDHKQRYEGACYMAEQIPGAKLVTLEDSAHMGQLEEINAFNQALVRFAREACSVKRAA